MSRSGYDCYHEGLELYRAAVTRATNGKRGQKLLRDLRDALDAMPEKELINTELKCADGVCALGALGVARGLDMTDLDPEDAPLVGAKFNIAQSLAREIVYENDEANYYPETPDVRWTRMRDWVDSQILEEA